jgi:hypothetical protein
MRTTGLFFFLRAVERSFFKTAPLRGQKGHETVTVQLIVARCNVDLQANIGLTCAHVLTTHRNENFHELFLFKMIHSTSFNNCI